MKKILRYKDEKVCVFDMTSAGMLLSVPEIFTPELLPLGAVTDTEEHLKDWMSEWWRRNMIPAERDSIRLGLECIGVRTEEELKLLSHGLSLTNHYWLSDPDETVTWKDINFGDNGFSEEVGLALFNHRPMRNGVYCSPDTSLNGQLKKKWISRDGAFYLVKSGSSYLGQEVFNEKLASDLFEAAHVPHVKYEITKEKEIVSICECMTDRAHELIPASQICNSIDRIPYPAEKEIDYFYRLMEHYGIRYSKKQINDMLCIDYMMAGTDRHYSNIGFLRDDETQAIELAPVYDNGTSMWCGKRLSDIDILDDSIMARPFCDKSTFGRWSEQRELITEYPDLLPEDIIHVSKTYAKGMLADPDIPPERVALLGRAVLMRANQLQEHLLKREIVIKPECRITQDHFRELEKWIQQEAIRAQRL